MQQLDALSLKRLAAEMQATYGGSKINKVQHLSRHEFVLHLWAAKTDRLNRLYINLQAEMPVILPAATDELRELVENEFDKPTGFCMLLRKHLNNAKITEIYTLPGERVLNLILENYNELGNRVRLLLSLELMGKHSNMLLVDDLQGTILGAARTVSESLSRYREVGVNLPYVPPPKPEGKPAVFDATADQVAPVWHDHESEAARVSALVKNFWGPGKQVLGEFVAAADSPEAFLQRLRQAEAGENLVPAADASHFYLLGGPPGARRFDDVTGALRHYVFSNLEAVRLKAMVQVMLSAIRRQRQRLEKRFEEQSPVDPASIDQLQHYGNLLLTAISSGRVSGHPEGHTIELTDFEGHPVTLKVDPALAFSDNAQRYFQKARKERSRHEHYEQTRKKLRQEARWLDELAWMARQCDSLSEARQLRQELIEAGLLRRKKVSGAKGADKQVAGMVEGRSSDGYTLYVGKSGKANALLVGKLSRPEDLWLHVHEVPGSHVLIKTNKQEVPDQTLLEAAHLAVYYSSARHGTKVPVIYTPMQYVKKIPDSYPGHVNYREEQTVFVTADEDLVTRVIGGPDPEAE